MTGVEIAVYSDASVRDGLGAWGAVIIRPGEEPLEASAKLRLVHFNTDLQELRSAANAIQAGIKASLIRKGDRVVVRCDNANAVQWINGEPFKRARTNRRHDFREVAQWIRETAERLRIVVSAERVPGHQRADSPDPHAVHNRRADRLCNIALSTHKVRRSKSRPPQGVRRARAKLASTAATAAIAIAGELRS